MKLYNKTAIYPGDMGEPWCGGGGGSKGATTTGKGENNNNNFHFTANIYTVNNFRIICRWPTWDGVWCMPGQNKFSLFFSPRAHGIERSRTSTRAHFSHDHIVRDCDGDGFRTAFVSTESHYAPTRNPDKRAVRHGFCFHVVDDGPWAFSRCTTVAWQSKWHPLAQRKRTRRTRDRRFPHGNTAARFVIAIFVHSVKRVQRKIRVGHTEPSNLLPTTRNRVENNTECDSELWLQRRIADGDKRT